MYSDSDLESAVAAGAISASAADALRAHVAAAHSAPAVDEENFRLVNSFNDIFVTIAAIMVLVAMGTIGAAFTPGLDGPAPLSGVLVAAAAWGMAEFFTRKRRMALPSIVLLLAFVGGVFGALLGFAGLADSDMWRNETLGAGIGSGAALLTAGAAYLHWRRFMVPITVAAGAASIALFVIALVLAIVGEALEDAVLPLVFVAGLAVFAFAMRWDMSDRQRETRRADVAFWLHLLAAPMIAHPLFNWIGVTGGENVGAGGAAAVLVVYVAMGVVALAIDRRALLVSALAYVLFALTWLFDRFGAVELNVALTALVIGSALLCLSAFWTPIRRAVVETLPASLQGRLPVIGLVPA
jgi:MFS family permease